MNEHFLTYEARRVALYGIIGALIMLIYSCHERALSYAQVAFIMFTQVIYSYLKSGAFAESDVAHSYEPTVWKKLREIWDKLATS